jgi:hypothetical protein
MRIVAWNIRAGGGERAVAIANQLAAWAPTASRTDEIPFVVARIVLQDFTGVPLLADLAAMRGVASKMGRNPKVIEPLVPVDLVVDHSIQIDHYGTSDALELNMKLEFQRNRERYQFMKWGMQAFDTFKVVPPGVGIVHQVNLEYLARGVHEKNGVYYPDTLVGTDSHTTMINGLGVVGWGVGGIEALRSGSIQGLSIITVTFKSGSEVVIGPWRATAFPGATISTPWSAAFITWLIKQAAPNQMKGSPGVAGLWSEAQSQQLVLRPDEKPLPGDIVVFPNTAGYLMHSLESSSHQMPLARRRMTAHRRTRHRTAICRSGVASLSSTEVPGRRRWDVSMRAPREDTRPEARARCRRRSSRAPPASIT